MENRSTGNQGREVGFVLCLKIKLLLNDQSIRMVQF